jgi:hypothetical protein
MPKIVKNLIVRGLAAALVAVVSELASSSRRPAKPATGSETVSEAEAWVRSVTGRAAEWAHDADVSDHVREVCRRILTTGVADRSEATIARLIDAGEAKMKGVLRRK